MPQNTIQTHNGHFRQDFVQKLKYFDKEMPMMTNLRGLKLPKLNRTPVFYNGIHFVSFIHKQSVFCNMKWGHFERPKTNATTLDELLPRRYVLGLPKEVSDLHFGQGNSKLQVFEVRGQKTNQLIVPKIFDYFMFYVSEIVILERPGLDFPPATILGTHSSATPRPK